MPKPPSSRHDCGPFHCSPYRPLLSVQAASSTAHTSAGRAICQRLIDQAREDGFEKVYLDTSIAFAPARALYSSLGFIERGAYQPMPEFTRDAICFFELPLTDIPSSAGSA